MQCPRCYNKIGKDKNRCDSCGFNINDLNDASNKEAKKALKSIYKDDVLYTTKLPADVNKKRLLLFSIFFGLFGVHHFMVGKFWTGLYMAVASGLTLIVTTILAYLNSITNNIFQIIFEFLTVFQGIAVIMWFSDIISIATNKFKVPVYKESFSK